MGIISINLDGTIGKPEVIVGIDLGTTNSLIAYINKHNGFAPECIKDIDGSSLVPSIIHFKDDKSIIIGQDAKSYLLSDPKNTIFSIKRLMGKSYKDIAVHDSFFSYKILDEENDKLVRVQIDDKFYTPVELSSYILKELKERAERILDVVINKAVITVPAYFNDNQRQATRDAGKLAGLEVLRIINEPTAASLAYGIGLNTDDEKTIAVYDLGGGTFDVSILKIHDGIFEVLSTHGDTFLGGDDIDRAIISYWMEKYPNLKNQIESDHALRLMAERTKIALSQNETYSELYNNIEIALTVEELKLVSQALIKTTLKCCERAIIDSKISLHDLDLVLMVGGSTRMPIIKQAVSDYFGKPIIDSINPDEVVALGAAIQADILSGRNKDLLLLDVTPLSLGIETIGGLMDVIIPRNSKIPTKAGRQYTTHIDGQSQMRITVYQGERDRVADNRKLAEFNLNNIPGMPAGLPKVDITFMLNADGILKITARELRSGIEQNVEVKPQYGLTDEEVETMLLDSIQHAKEDIIFRGFTEARTEAENIILATRKFIIQNQLLFEQEVIDKLSSFIEDLQKNINEGNKDRILFTMDNLNNYAKPYAELAMNGIIGSAMKDKHI